MGRPKFVHAASAALLNAVTVGVSSTYSSTATESMKSSSLNPTDTEISWIGSCLPLGAILGGIIAGYLAEKIGRKGVMMYLQLLLLTGWLLIAYAPSLPFVYVGRFCTGVCCGLICVVTPMYIVEIARPEVRGDLGCRFQMFICIGIIFVSVLGKYVSWSWVAIGGSVVAVLSPFVMLFIPDSPCWLLKKGQHAEAASAIKFLYGNQEEGAVEFIYNDSKALENKINIDITQPTIYKPALLSIGLMFFQQFSGSNAILYYTVHIFKEAKSSIPPTTENIMIAVVMFTFTLLSCFLMDRLGRKISLILSGLITCCSLNVLSIYLVMSQSNSHIKESYGWIPLACLIAYIAAFSIGLGPIPWLMMSEMSPTYARSFICGLGTAFSWIFVFIITKSFISIEHSIHDYGTYWFYSFFCLLCCVFTIFLPETKGKSFEEIKGFFASGESRLQRLQEEVADEENVSIQN